jgi:hypothetical protein
MNIHYTNQYAVVRTPSGVLISADFLDDAWVETENSQECYDILPQEILDEIKSIQE